MHCAVKAEVNLYVDVDVAVDVQRTNRMAYTHCEIHPAMILGVCASIIPFPDHNQVGSTRSLLACTCMLVLLILYFVAWDKLLGLLRTLLVVCELPTA